MRQKRAHPQRSCRLGLQVCQGEEQPGSLDDRALWNLQNFEVTVMTEDVPVLLAQADRACSVCDRLWLTFVDDDPTLAQRAGGIVGHFRFGPNDEPILPCVAQTGE